MVMGRQPKCKRQGGCVDKTVDKNFLRKEMALFATCHPIILKHPIANQVTKQEPGKYVHG